MDNQKGFSLVSVLVAAAIAGGLAVVVMQINSMMAKAEKKGMVAYDLLDTMIELRGKLKDEEYCNQNFKNKNATDHKATGLVKKSGGIDYNEERKLGASRVVIKEIVLTDRMDRYHETKVVANEWGTSELQFKFFEKSVGWKMRSLKLNVLTDGGFNIERCFAGEPISFSASGNAMLPKMQIVKQESGICRSSQSDRQLNHCEEKCEEFEYTNANVESCLSNSDTLVCLCSL